MKACDTCTVREVYAKVFDMHFDERDCPYKSEQCVEIERSEDAAD